GEQEVQRSPTALGDDGVHGVPERGPSNEERERLVLVRRPGPEEPTQDPGERGRRQCRTGPEEVRLLHTRARAGEQNLVGRKFVHVNLFSKRIQADNAGTVLLPVPTYEYKCPNGH